MSEHLYTPPIIETAQILLHPMRADGFDPKLLQLISLIRSGNLASRPMAAGTDVHRRDVLERSGIRHRQFTRVSHKNFGDPS
jgi:hypothetical protein